MKLNFYLDDEGLPPGQVYCKLELQGGLDDDVDLFDSGLDPSETELIEALLVLNPDCIRTLFDHVTDAAYQLGLRHGIAQAEAGDTVLMILSR